jgi:hypothetical protein
MVAQSERSLTEMAREDERLRLQAKRWEERNLSCLSIVDDLRQLRYSRELIIPVDPGGKLGQVDQLDYGSGHGPAWKERVGPLVPEGRAGARGPEWLIYGYLQPEYLSSLPNGFKPCGSSADSELTHILQIPPLQLAWKVRLNTVTGNCRWRLRLPL